MPLADRTFLVTGGTGFLGSAIVRRLVGVGARVRVLDDGSRGTQERLGDLKDRIDLIDGDVRDPSVVADACRGTDCVVHLAFVNGTRYFYERPELVLDVGVRGMVNVIDGTLRHGVRELFVASSSEVYQSPPRIPTDETVPLSIPDPLNPRYSYAGGKIISELLAINFGRRGYDRVVLFRPHNVYGPDMGREHVIPELADRAARLARSSTGPLRLPIQGSGEETRAFIFVDDFVDGVVRLLERGRHLNIYNIGSDREVPIREVARLVGAALGREVTVVPGELRAGGTLRRCPDISKVRALGFEPRTSLADGISTTVRWYADRVDGPDLGARGV